MNVVVRRGSMKRTGRRRAKSSSRRIWRKPLKWEQGFDGREGKKKLCLVK